LAFTSISWVASTHFSCYTASFYFPGGKPLISYCPFGPVTAKNGNSIREIVLRWAKAAGIEKEVSPHTFRRSCATGMIRNRANLAHVKDLLGHDDFRSLDAYVCLEIQDLKDAHRRFHPRE
jgi:integrase